MSWTPTKEELKELWFEITTIETNEKSIWRANLSITHETFWNLLDINYTESFQIKHKTSSWFCIYPRSLSDIETLIRMFKPN